MQAPSEAKPRRSNWIYGFGIDRNVCRRRLVLPSRESRGVKDGREGKKEKKHTICGSKRKVIGRNKYGQIK